MKKFEEKAFKTRKAIVLKIEVEPMEGDSEDAGEKSDMGMDTGPEHERMNRAASEYIAKKGKKDGLKGH